METVKTATGKTYSCDYFNPFPPANQVNLRVLGVPLPAVAAVFSDTSETRELWYGKQVLTQHTKLKAIVPEGDAIRVVLEKE